MAAPSSQQGYLDTASNMVSGVVEYFTGSVQENRGESYQHVSKEVGPNSDWEVIDHDCDIEPDEGFRPTNQVHSQYRSEIEGLRKNLETSNKQKAEQSRFVSKLNRDNQHLNNELASKDKKIAAMRQEARECELKLEAEISKLQQQLSRGTHGGDNAEKGLRDHIREQSKAIFELRQTLEMTSTDPSSSGNLLHEVEEDRDKLKEDFGSARKEIVTLQTRIKDLGHELQSSKMETMKQSEAQLLSSCSAPKCKAARAELNQAHSEHEADMARVASLERVVESQKKQIKEIGSAKNEEISLAKAEAETYKNDFLEEREDRAKAKGALEELRKEKEEQDTVFHEERALLQKEICRVEQERDDLKTICAENEAKLRKEQSNAKIVIGNLKEQTEKIGLERDDWKHEVERRKASKHHKIKDYDRMREQLRRSLDAIVDLTNQLDMAKKEKRVLSKDMKKVEEKYKKLEKKQTKAHGSSTLQSELSSESRQTSAERRYQEEQDRNESLLFENESLKDDVEHNKYVIVTLKSLIAGEQMEAASSPATLSEKSLVSPTSEQKTIAGETDNLFQDDPHYVSSEDMGLEEQLQVGFSAGHQVPFVAGTGHLEKQSRKEATTPQAPKEQVMNRTQSSEKYKEMMGVQQNTSRSGQHPYNLRNRQSDKNQEANMSTNCGSNLADEHSHAEASGQRKRPLDMGDKLSEEARTRPNPPSPIKGDHQQPLRAGAQTPTQPPQLQFPSKCRAGGGQEEFARPQLAQAKLPTEGHLEKFAPPQPLKGQFPPQPPKEWFDNAGGQRRSTPLQPPMEQLLRHSSQELFLSEGYAGGQGEFAPPQLPEEQFQRESHVGGQSRSAPHRPLRKNLPPHLSQEQFRSESCAGDQGELASQQPPKEQFQGEGRQRGPHEQFRKGAGLCRLPLHSDGNALNNMDLDSRGKCASHPLANEPKRNDPKHASTTQSSDAQASLDYNNVTPGVTTPPAQEALAKQTSTAEKPANSISNVQRKGKPSSWKRDKLELSTTENLLVKEIDEEIEDMAAEVQEEVSTDNEVLVTMVHKPFDPNLVCPMCGKEHRIGEIQKFRVHVDQCEGD